MQTRYDELAEELNDKMSKYGKAMTFLQRSMSIQEKIMFIFASDNLAQLFRRIRYIKEYSSYQRAQGTLIREEQNEVRNTKNSLLQAKADLETSMYKLETKKKDLEITKADCQKKVEFLNQNLNEVKSQIDAYQKREAAIDAQIERIIQAEIEAARKKAEEEARRKAEAARKAAEAKAKAEAAKKAAEAKARAEAQAKAKAEAERKAAEAKRKAEQDALTAKKAAEAKKKAEAERKAAEAAARKAKSDAEKAEAERKAAEARKKEEAAKKAAEEAKRREDAAKAAEEAAKKKAEAEAKAAKEKAKEAEKTTEKAAKIERSEYKASSVESTSDAASAAFEANKGRLQLPVSGGAIVGHYGKYTVAGAANVTLDNKGIDIKGAPGCVARSVYAGTVSSIFNYAGSYIVMVRHGKYISVYSGLSSVSVSNGTNVQSGQTLGAVGTDENGNHILHFQLRKGSSRLNPEAWVR